MSKIKKEAPSSDHHQTIAVSSHSAEELTLPFRNSFAPEDNETKTVFRDGRAAANTTHLPPVGSVLVGRFQLEEMIGVGGMSCVYKAVDLRRIEARSKNPFLAVKVLTVPFDHYSDSMQALEREAHKLQSLSHPNIVRVIDIDRDDETVFMTMEYLSGASLQTRLASADDNSCTRQATDRIITSIANALEFAHRSGIVHGDLKPGNVIITAADDVKVIDFGIARFLAHHQDGGDVEVLNALTPPYASPEMLEQQVADPRDDVYALACIAHELLTGLHPFGRMSSLDARAVGAKLGHHARLTPHQYTAIARGLSFERERRTASARAFIDEFCGKPKRPAAVLLIGAVAAIALVAGLYFFKFRDPLSQAPLEAATPPVGQVFRDCPTCPLMTVVPPGSFIQGSAAEGAEQPPHLVSIAAPIALAPREVTIGEFDEFATDVGLQTRGCNVYDGEWRWRADVRWDTVDDNQTALHPVTCVSWDDAVAYAAWLSKKTGHTYRLPSASEWEYAASAGQPAATPLGVDVAAACRHANVADRAAAGKYPGWQVLACDDRHVQSAPVASFAANAFHLHDMIGNVFEWVEDCWQPSYVDAPTDGAARENADCMQREMRGGSWFTLPAYLRASYRNQFEHTYRSSSVGFRVAREVRK